MRLKNYAKACSMKSTAQQSPRAPESNAVQNLQDMLSRDMAAVNQEIVARMHSPVALIPQLAAHIVAAGGKRLRPLLTLASAKLCGYEGPRAIKLAACVEFIHTATLLHDDVVDESEKRRGQDTANAVWGNKASVLVGDFLFSRSFQLMVEDGSLDVLRILSNASATIAEGEVHQLLTANNLKTTESQYREVIGAKTAALFAAACEIGAVIANRPKTEQQALHDYGFQLGLAFQIADDVLDYYGLPGKQAGDDFRDGKVTLPVILALPQLNDEEKSLFQKCFEDSVPQPGDFEKIFSILKNKGCLNRSLEAAQNAAASARQALQGFEDSELKSALETVATFSASRL